MNTINGEHCYKDGSYLESTGGTWHLEDSPFKARQIIKMINKHSLDIRTVCEIGCGVGGVLAAIQERIDKTTKFVGFDISPQAHEISKGFCKDNLTFQLGDAFKTKDFFDLVLVVDVIEHIEDYFDFLRKTQEKGQYKIFHIPLEIHCSAALRDSFAYSWKKVGHIHAFALSTALESLRYTGHEIVDYFLTPAALESGKIALKTRLMNVCRRMVPAPLSARLFGGYSVLVLTR